VSEDLVPLTKTDEQDNKSNCRLATKGGDDEMDKRDTR